MTADLAALERALSRTALSMRVQAGLDWASLALAASALGAGMWHAIAPGVLTLHGVAATVLCSSLAAGLCGVLWPPSVERIARSIDRAGQLEGRVLAAVFLRREPADRQTAFMHAAVYDAARHASAVSAHKAAPLRAPRAWWQASLALLALLAWEFAAPRPAPSPVGSEPRHTAEREPLLDRDELSGLRAEVSGSIHDDALSPALRAQLEAYNALLTQLGEPGMSDDDAIAHALALEATLPGDVRSADDDALLRRLAADLSHAQPGLAQALTRELAEAARALQRLSADLRAGKLPSTERAELAAALEHARAQERERLAQSTQQEQDDRLLRPRQASSPTERSVLRRDRDARRQLEGLRRTLPQAGDQRELRRLSRELARAGDALAQQDSEQAASALEQASKALDELAERERESTQGRELARAVAQLRELLQRRAQAQSAPSRESPEPQPTQQSQASAPRGERGPGAGTSSAATRRRTFERRADGEDDETDAGATSRRSAASGEGTEGQPSSTTTLLLPGSVQQRVDIIESAGGGSEHDERRLATPPPRRAHAGYQDHLLRGVQGTGPTRSQVIRGAASAGFANSAYRKVYGDYRAHAEAVLERDEVPAGARYQVRRYFELVRPREGQDAHD